MVLICSEPVNRIFVIETPDIVDALLEQITRFEKIEVEQMWGTYKSIPVECGIRVKLDVMGSAMRIIDGETDFTKYDPVFRKSILELFAVIDKKLKRRERKKPMKE